jgi:uncharacterized iron-regulated protein
MKQWATKSVTGVAVFLLLIFFCQAASAEPQVLRLKDRRVITFQTMINEVRKAQVIFFGESHSFPWHHEMELKVIRALKREGTDMAVGLEMFQARSQDVLDRWSSGSMSVKAFIPQYYANWNMPWPLYKNIFLYIRQRHIPAIGLNVPQYIADKVASTGFDSLSPKELRELPPGVSCDLDPQYMAYVRQVYKMHEGHGKGKFQYFCEAQVLWEQAMAWYLQKYRKKHPGQTVVVLTGGNHAMKPGIPRQLGRDSNPPTMAVIVPEIPGDDTTAMDSKQADYVILFPKMPVGQ